MINPRENAPEPCELCQYSSFSLNAQGICRMCMETHLIDEMINDDNWHRQGASIKPPKPDIKNDF